MNVRWKDLLTEAYRARDGASSPSLPRFEPGATEARLERAERALGLPLPEELRTLLAECDGVMEVMEVGGQPIETGWLVWTLDAIVDERRGRKRTTLGPPDGWLMFANAGADGILFGYDQGEPPGHIGAWYPMEGGRLQFMAPSLQAFLRGWIAGELSV
jgi:hypothetical protein